MNENEEIYLVPASTEYSACPKCQWKYARFIEGRCLLCYRCGFGINEEGGEGSGGTGAFNIKVKQPKHIKYPEDSEEGPEIISEMEKESFQYNSGQVTPEQIEDMKKNIFQYMKCRYSFKKGNKWFYKNLITQDVYPFTISEYFDF